MNRVKKVLKAYRMRYIRPRNKRNSLYRGWIEDKLTSNIYVINLLIDRENREVIIRIKKTNNKPKTTKLIGEFYDLNEALKLYLLRIMEILQKELIVL